MELRSRPFAYAEAPQLDLDSLLLYTTSIAVDVSGLHCSCCGFTQRYQVFVYICLHAGTILCIWLYLYAYTIK